MTKLAGMLSDINYNICVLNPSDAKIIGVDDGERVKIYDPVTKQSAVSFAFTSLKFVEVGTFIMGKPVSDALHVDSEKEYLITCTAPPKSVEYISKKIHGKKLLRTEIEQIISDINADILTPPEITAFIFGTHSSGLDIDEIEYVTSAMVDTGSKMHFSKHPVVDKHSIGGVPGNKISLVIVPLISAAGLIIPKASSRAITGAGGTADLMEALAPVIFPAERVIEMAEMVNGVLVFGSDDITPVDRKIYKYEAPYRIDPYGLMIASVMSKKIACGAEYIGIDIPVGESAKIKTLKDAQKLGHTFIELGRRFGVMVECEVTDGSVPIGHTLGVNLEVSEALRALEGKDPDSELVSKSVAIAGMILEMAGKAKRGTGPEVARSILESGKALEKMKEIIAIQGGNPNVTSEDFKPGKFSYRVLSSEGGVFTEINNSEYVIIARIAGAPTRHGAGILLNKSIGDRVAAGELLYTIYSDDELLLEQAVLEALTNKLCIVNKLIYCKISDDDKADLK